MIRKKKNLCKSIEQSVPTSEFVSANHHLHPRHDLETFRLENKICVLISPQAVLKCAKVWDPCYKQCCWAPIQVSSPTSHSDVQTLAANLGFQQFSAALSLFLRTVLGGRKAIWSEMPGGPRLIPGASAVIYWLTDIGYQRSPETLFTIQTVLGSQPEAVPQLSPIFDQLLSLPWSASLIPSQVSPKDTSSLEIQLCFWKTQSEAPIWTTLFST